MNKNRYRVIYCKARQVFMAVAENVKANAKTKSVTAPEQAKNVISENDFQQKNFTVKALTVLTSMLIPFGNIHAQIQVDAAAAVNNKPVIGVGTATGGVQIPVVNIQTPTNGVSHNKYTQFDILSGGMVLNNSRTGSTTKLVGNVAANPFLQTGEARIILNEVNSPTASRFEGILEVAGQMADVIIANPSGINVKGAGFYNVNKATLVTGQVGKNADGSIKDFTVTDGKIKILDPQSSDIFAVGLGPMGYGRSNYVDIYTRALEIGHKIQAVEGINIVTGTNQISNDGTVNQLLIDTTNLAKPAYAIDIKAMGGTYANNVFLTGTEKGLGVNIEYGAMVNGDNNLLITSAGKITNKGAIEAVGNEAYLGLKTTSTGVDGDIDNSLYIRARGTVVVDSANDVNMTFGVIGGHNVNATSNHDVYISAKNNLNLGSSSSFENLNKNGDLYFTGKNLTLDYYSRVISERDIILDTENFKTIKGVSFTSKNNIYINTIQSLALNETIFNTNTGAVNISTSNKGNGSIDLNKNTFNVKGDLNLNSNGSINIKDANFTATNGVGNLKSFNAYTLDDFTWNQVSTLPVYKYNGNFNVVANDQFSSNIRNFNAMGDVNLSANAITPIDNITSGNNVKIISKNSSIHLPKVKAEKDISIISNSGSISAVGANIESTNGKISLIANNNIDIQPTVIVEPAPYASRDGKTTTKNFIKAKDDITIASLSNGLIKIGPSSIKSENLVNVSTSGLINVSGDTDYQITGGNNSIPVEVRSDITGKGINIISKANDLKIDSVDLNSGIDGIKLTSTNNTIAGSVLNSIGNIELSAIKSLLVNASQINTDKHVSFNGGESIRFNSYSDNFGVLTYYPVISNINANGMLSLTSKGDIVLNNLNLFGGSKLKAGGILIEADRNLVSQQPLMFEATGNDLFKLDPDLADLDGSVTIRNANSIVLDNNYKVSATGNIDLYSTAGDLIIKGAGGDNGQNSAQVQNITTSGSISLVGNNVKVQGATIKAGKDITLVAKNGDLVIDSVKSSLINKNSSQKLTELNQLNIETDTKLKTLLADSAYVYKKNNFLKEINDLKILVTDIDSDYYNGNSNCAMDYYAGCELIPDYERKIGLMFADYNKHISPEVDLKNRLNLIASDLSFFSKQLNGYEHLGATINAINGNVVLSSSNGVGISGANINADKGFVNIESAGTLSGNGYNIQGIYNGIKENSVKQGIIKGGIIIDATQDSYEIGVASDSNYAWRSPVNSTTINADKGVNIRATGRSNTDNLILQGTAIASNGDVNIEAYKNIIFDVAVDNSYDKSTTTETKRKWYGKKKSSTTVATSGQNNGESVDIYAKNINIKSEEKNTLAMAGKNRTSIDLYSSKLTANGGKINIKAGGDLNFLTVNDISQSTVDITKKSSWLGIKYNSSDTTSTRNIKSELPAILTADYINTYSGFDTRLKGTVFNYLQGATIEAGGTLSIENASKIVENTLKKEKNSVVWQSMQDKGSIIETAKLPSFNGPAPTFIAGGGLIVQVPSKDALNNENQIKAEVLRIASQPGAEYLKALTERNDIDWSAVKLVNEQWNIQQEGLTPAGAAILAIVVTIATGGLGTAGMGASLAGAQGATSAAIANAAFTSLATQASVSLVNNKGNIGAVLKELGSTQTVKSLLTSVVTAGLLDKIGGTQWMGQFNGTGFTDRLVTGLVNSTGSALVNTAVNGGSLSDNLQAALLNGFAGAVQGSLAGEIGVGLDKIDPSTLDYILHKVAHAAAGCVAGAIQKQCEAGAIGAAIGEVVSEQMLDGRNPTFVSDTDKFKIDAAGKLVAATIAAYAGFDVNFATQSASIAIQNNSLKDKALLKIQAGREYLDTQSKAALDKLIDAYKRGDIVAAQNFKNQLDDAILAWATSGSYNVLGVNSKAAIGSLAYAVGTLVVPTNAVDIIPIGKLGKAAKIIDIPPSAKELVINAAKTADLKTLPLNVNGKTFIPDPALSQGAAIYKGATNEDIYTAFKEIAGVTVLPSSNSPMYRYIPGKTSISGNPGYIITVPQADGSKVVLRNFSDSQQVSKARFTIEIQKPAGMNKNSLELKFQ